MRKLRRVTILLTGCLLACSDDGATKPDSGGSTDVVSATKDGGQLPGKGSIGGLVKDTRDRAIGDVTVSAGSKSTISGFDGTYSLSNLAPGSVDVTFAADWFVSKTEGLTLIADKKTSLDVTLDDMPLKLEAADRSAAEAFNKSFDWSKSKLSISIVPQPTRGAIEAAIFWLNPALYRDTSSDKTVTPTSKPTIKAGTGENFDFKVADGPGKDKQALVAATIVDKLSDTPLSASEIGSFLVWEPALKALSVWDPAKILGLSSVGAAVDQQQWGGDVFRPQRLEKVFLHDGQIWVQLAFEPVVELGEGITDSDGDGRKEVFARLDEAHFAKEVYEQLSTDYASKKLDTAAARSVIDAVVELLYSKTNPSIKGTIGKPYDAGEAGTLSYPFVVLQHGDDGPINVLLLGPDAS